MAEEPKYCVHIVEPKTTAVPWWRYSPKPCYAQIGADFILVYGSPTIGNILVRFAEITRVAIKVSKGRIAGVVVYWKGLAVPIVRVKTPGVVVRAIFDKGPTDVKWCRTWPPYWRLSREDVERLIEQSDAPDIYTLLPPGQKCGRADEIFPDDAPTAPCPKPKGLLARWFGGGDRQEFHVKSYAIPSPTGKYVAMMLMQMSENEIQNHVLEKSEPLPSITFDSETVKPAPLDDIVNDLKTKCGVSLHRRAPIEGRMELTINGTPYRLECRFDNDADICCRIRLTKIDPTAEGLSAEDVLRQRKAGN